MNTVGIILIGDELLSGSTQDTNGCFLADALTAVGFKVRAIHTVADEQSAIVAAIQLLAAQVSLIITSGGLGPTSDDLTRQALAKATGVELEENSASLAKLEEYARRRGVSLSAENKRQAFFPGGSEILSNRAGTADAFICFFKTHNGAVPIIALPGVPKELKILIKELVVPWCKSRFSTLRPAMKQYLKLFGVSEAYIGSVIERCGLPAIVKVAYRPNFPEILLSLTLNDIMQSAEEERIILERAEQRIKHAIGDEFVFSQDPKAGMAQVVGELLIEKKMTLACAESCSGGLLAHEIVSCPGASKYFLGSVVSYSDRWKENLLGVGPEELKSWGAVSEVVALSMAQGIRRIAGSDIALSVTGIAGPEGGTEAKPVGTVWLALAASEVERAICLHLPWDREYVRKYSVVMSLDLVRRLLLGLPLGGRKNGHP